MHSTPRGYIRIQLSRGRFIFEHVQKAENAIGKKLPRGAVVHHVNGKEGDNRNENLVICPNQSYHRLLHTRDDARKACGHLDWRRCGLCKVYSPLSDLMIYGRSFQHRDCRNNYQRRAALRRKNA